MSLSNQTEIKTPAQRFFEWSSTDKTVKWYDKEAKENVLVKLPFSFIVLDDGLSTVKGFSDADGGGIWSNEIRDTRTDILTVRTKKGVRAQGLYQDVKQSVEGARYCRSVYIAYKDDDGTLVIGNFQMHGAANGEYIEFRKKNKVYGVGIQITGSEERKKGSNKFSAPVFATVEVSPEAIEVATMLDRELQEYLKAYFGRAQAAATQDEYADDEPPYFDSEPPEFTGNPDAEDTIPF